MATAMPGAGLREGSGGLPVRLRRVVCPVAAGLRNGRVCSARGHLCRGGADGRARAKCVVSGPRPGDVARADVRALRDLSRRPARPTALNGAIRDVEAAYAQLSAALKYDIPRRVPIILVRGHRDLSGISALQSGAPAGQRLVISLESLERRTGIVVHELTHQFAFDIIPGTSRVAPVLIEGLAEHQRGAWMQTTCAGRATASPQARSRR